MKTKQEQLDYARKLCAEINEDFGMMILNCTLTEDSPESHFDSTIRILEKTRARQIADKQVELIQNAAAN